MKLSLLPPALFRHAGDYEILMLLLSPSGE